MSEPVGLFVYGTLKTNQLNCFLLAPYARSVQRAWTKGELFDVGSFPALTEGNAAVYGELVSVDSADLAHVLEIVDELEGYASEAPVDSLYIRRVIDVVTESGHEARAYAYFYNESCPGFPSASALRRIETGKWAGPDSNMASENAALEEFSRHVRTYRRTGET